MSYPTPRKQKRQHSEGGPSGGAVVPKLTVTIPLEALPVSVAGDDECEEWFGEDGLDIAQQRVFLLNATFRCIRAAIELANAAPPAYLDIRRRYKPETDHCRGSLHVKREVLENATPVQLERQMDAAAIQKAFLTSWKVFSDGLRPLWRLLELGDEFDLLETMVKQSTTLPKGYTLVHQMNFTQWTKSNVDFDQKWTGKFAMWWTPLLDAADVAHYPAKTNEANMLSFKNANFVAMAKRPICGFLNIDAFESKGRQAGVPKRTGFYALVSDYLEPICKLTEDEASKATFQPDGLLGTPMRDGYVNTESCWKVVKTVRGTGGMGRDRTLPRLLEQAFSGWVLRYDPQSKLERQVVLFPHVRADELVRTWKLGYRPADVDVSDAIGVHVRDPMSGLRPSTKIVNTLLHDQGVAVLEASQEIADLGFLPKDLQTPMFISGQIAALTRAARTGDLGTVKRMLLDLKNFTAHNIGTKSVLNIGISAALQDAARNGHTEVVAEFLKDGRAEPQATDSAALRLAATNGHTDVVDLLLKDSHAQPQAVDSSALRFAAKNGHTDVVELLLKDGRADPGAIESEALRLAVTNGHTDVVDLLLKDRHAEPQDVDSSALRFAAQYGHTDVVGMFLEDGRAEPKAKESEALRFAAMNGHTDIVGLLLKDGRAEPTAVNSSALRSAAKNGHTDIVYLLLKDRRADPSTHALPFAAENGHTKIVRMLLKDGRAKPKDGTSFYKKANDSEALWKAAMYGHTDIVELLLKDGRAEPKAVDSAALQYAAQSGHTDVVELLLKDGRAEPKANQSAPLQLAAQNGHVEIVKLLLKDGREARAEPSDNGSGALRVAAESGKAKVVELLLKDGRAKPNDMESDALRLAAQNGHAEVVELLLKDGREVRAEPSAFGSVALRRAAERGYAKVVGMLLLDRRAEPKAYDSDALTFAAMNGHTDVVGMLLEDGRAEPKANQSAALRRAAQSGHVEVVELLLKDGRAKPNDKDSDALRRAAMNGHTDVVELLLLDRRAEPKAYDSDALTMAATNGHTDVVEMLLEDGRAYNSEALEWAIQNGHAKVVELLRKYDRQGPP